MGQHVKLPGPSADRPNAYAFGTTYEYMLSDLKSKDESLYERNGLLTMLKRNMAIKRAPERWQARPLQLFAIATYVSSCQVSRRFPAHIVS